MFLKGELSVKDFNKITFDRYKLDFEYKDTFVIPDKCGDELKSKGNDSVNSLVVSLIIILG